MWKTSGETEKVINDESQNVSNLGIFRLRVLGVWKQGSTVVEVNSTATTATGVQLKDNNTKLSCIVYGSNFFRRDAFLRVAGTLTKISYPNSAPDITFENNIIHLNFTRIACNESLIFVKIHNASLL